MSLSRPPPQGTEREPGRGRRAVSLTRIFFLKISTPHARAYVCARVPAPPGTERGAGVGVPGVPDGSAQAVAGQLERLPAGRRGSNVDRPGPVEGRIAPGRALMGGRQAAARRPNGPEPG